MRSVGFIGLLSFLAVSLAACSDQVTAPEAEEDPIDREKPEAHVPDAAAGKIAFESSCAGCHAAGDAFDLAYFSFSDFDIVRRAVAHIDTATAEDIVAYVRSLGVVGVNEETSLFQPGTRRLSTDREFWREVFGTDDWPAGLTADDIRAINPRNVSVPLKFLTWSSEGTILDWMPDSTLPQALLNLENGALITVIEAYRNERTESNLLEVVATLRRLSTDPSLSGSPICAGEESVHVYPAACYDVRRWASSLAATHYLRHGSPEEVPFPIAQIWWETGEAAVSVWAKNGTIENRTAAASWLYLGYSFAPEAFPERAGYLTQHLQTLGYPRLATFAALRRMVGDPAAQELPDQRYWDALLIATRIPNDLALDAVRFTFAFLRDGLLAGTPAHDPVFARQLIQQSWSLLVNRGVTGSNTEVEADVVALRDELVSLLD